MTRDEWAVAPDDAELVAYLDGELSPADSVRIGQRLATDGRLAARVEHLMKGGRPFREAFAPLLAEAPIARLEVILGAALARPAEPPLRWFGLRPLAAMPWPAAVAVAVVLLVVGAGLDRLVVKPLGMALLVPASPLDGSDDWRRAVAQYLSLYTSETLADIPERARPSAPQLEAIGRGLGLSLTPERIDLADLALMRADLYDYDGKPLVFLAYLDPQGGPVALCITPGRQGSDAQRIEQRRGMNAVYWSQGGHSFMLIGRAGPARLQALATSVASRFEVKADDRG